MKLKLKKTVQFSSPVLILILWFAGMNLWTGGFHSFTTYSHALRNIEPLPVPMPDLNLIDHNGRTVYFSDFRGKYLLVDFMYLHCSFVCGFLRSRLFDYQDELKREFGNDIKFISVSFDPARDDAATLNRVWLSLNSPGTWIFSSMDIRHYKSRELIFSELEKIGFVAYPTPDGSGDFNHTAVHYLLNRNGEVIRAIDPSGGKLKNIEEIRTALKLDSHESRK